MFLCSCAAGSDPPPASELIGDKPAPQRPAPIEQEEATQSDCHVDRHAVNNCLVTVVICNDEIKSVEVKCDRGRKLFPWEYIPDPQPDLRKE